MLGYQPQDILGKSVYDFYHPDDQLQMKETFEQGIVNQMLFKSTIQFFFCSNTLAYLFVVSLIATVCDVFIPFQKFSFRMALKNIILRVYLASAFHANVLYFAVNAVLSFVHL